MDVNYKGKPFSIEFTQIDELKVGFIVDRITDIPYNGERVNALDCMYWLGECVDKGYPVINEYDNIKKDCDARNIQLPKYSEVVYAFIEKVKWRFRIYAGDKDEKFTLWFKSKKDGTVLSKGEYSTKVCPSDYMKLGFKLLSGVELENLVELRYCDPPRDKRIKHYRLRLG